MKRLLLLSAIISAPSAAYDLGKLTSGKPEAVVEGKAEFFAVERCIVMMDHPNTPSVYRTPDRPNESLIYLGASIGKPVAYKLVRNDTGVTVTIYNGSKWRDQIAACAQA
jgi:hypothetical protein